MNVKKIISGIMASAVMIAGQTCFVPESFNSYAAANKSRASVHDPSIFKDINGTYYVFGSHIDAAKSNDLQSWKIFTNGYTAENNVIFGDLSKNLAGAFEWAGEDLEDCDSTNPNSSGFAVWAPDVVYNPEYVNKDGSKGAYMMYFCTTSTWIRSVICFGVSQNPEGPYEFVDTLIYSGFTLNDSYATSSTKNVNRKYTSTNIDELIASGEVTFNEQWFSGNDFNNNLFPNAIDPTIYYDTDGRMYMTYGSWSGGIFTLEIDKSTGKVIHPESSVTEDGRIIDSYFGTKLSGSYHKSGEGPFIEYNADTGYYYLWVTYGGLTSEGGYNMRVFRSKKPTGPFYDAAGNSAVMQANSKADNIGLKVMGNYKFSSLDKAYMACGHNSVLRDDDGKWYLINHARFDDGYEYHEIRVHSMYFNSEGWPVVAPYEYSGDVISEGGYNMSDIIGDYEFINHELDTSAVIHDYIKIKLNSDGTISGDAKGTWSQAEDSAQASFTVNGQKYDGYFMAVQDETGREKKVMTFSAVGNNNKTIWGAQTKEYTGTDRSGLIDYTNNDSQSYYNAESIVNSNGIQKIGDTDLLSGVSYFIENQNSGLLLEVKDGKTESGTNIQQWEINKGAHNEWRLTDNGNGYFRITLMSDESMAVTVGGDGKTDGLNVQLEKYTGADNQQFKLIKNGAYYGIVSKSSGDKSGLDVFEWSTENGGNVNQWEYWGGECQLWKITPVYPSVIQGEYTIKNVNSGKYISSSDGNIIQDSNADIWTIIPNPDGKCSIINSSNQAVTVENGSAADGTNIILAEYKEGKPEQTFKLNCNKDGSYSILTESSSILSCLDVFEISTENGANICEWNFWGGDGQKFVIEPATSETISGDVNADGKFDIADVVVMQKWLLNAADAELKDWLAGDLCKDGRIDVFDLCLMRKKLINK